MSDEKKRKKKREEEDLVEEVETDEIEEEGDDDSGSTVITGLHGEEIVITEMTGADERDLRQKNLVRTGEAFNGVMRRCISSIDDDDDITMEKVLDMDSSSRKLILMEIRRSTYGSLVEVTNIKCKECERDMVGEVEMPEEFPIVEGDPDFNEVKVSEGLVSLKPLTGREEKQLALMNKPDSLDALRVRIKDIDGEKRKRSKDFIKKMKAKSLQSIRETCKKLDGELVTKVEIFCDKCDAVNTLDLTELPNFFYLEIS